MFTSSQRALRLDGVLFVERSGELYLCCEVKNYVRFEAEGKPSVNSANKSNEIDPKPSDLTMSRMKLE